MEQAHLKAQQASVDRDEASAAIRPISQVYHPYDLKTWAKRSPLDVCQLIEDPFFTLDTIAKRAGLSESARGRIDKAWRVVDAMLDTVAWAHTEMGVRLSTLTLSQAEKTAVHAKLLPGLYIKLAAEKASKAELRHDLRATSARLLSEFDAAMAGESGFDQDRPGELYAVAGESVLAFQRSSRAIVRQPARTAV